VRSGAAGAALDAIAVGQQLAGDRSPIPAEAPVTRTSH